MSHALVLKAGVRFVSFHILAATAMSTIQVFPAIGTRTARRQRIKGRTGARSCARMVAKVVENAALETVAMTVRTFTEMDALIVWEAENPQPGFAPCGAQRRTTMYWIQDSKTGCYWAMGQMFWDYLNVVRVCQELMNKYGNYDLRVVSR